MDARDRSEAAGAPRAADHDRRIGSGSPTRGATAVGPGTSRTEPTVPPGGGVPAGSGTTSPAPTQANALRDSCSRAWSSQRPESTAVVPVGKNQLYVPYGTARPGVRLSVVPVCAVSSFSTTTVGSARSTRLIASGQRARAVSPAAATSSMAQAVLPSVHSGAVGSQPTYRPAGGARRYAAGSVAND